MSLAIFLIANAIRHHGRLRTLRETPQCTVAQISEGPVKVEGEAVALGPLLESPMSGTPCVYFQFKVEEQRTVTERVNPVGGQRRGGHNAQTTQSRNVWVTVIEDSQSTECGLRDVTGTAEVMLHEAEMTLLDVDRLKSGFLANIPPDVQRRLKERYGRDASTRGIIFNKSMRFTETVLEPGDPLLVLGAGEVERGKRPRIAREGATRLVVSNKDEATMTRHHGFVRAASAVGALAAVGATVAIALFVHGKFKHPLDAASPAPALAPAAAPLALTEDAPQPPAPARDAASDGDRDLKPMPDPPQAAVAEKSAEPAAPEKPAPPAPGTLEAESKAKPADEDPVERDMRDARSPETAKRTFALRRLKDGYKEPVEAHQADVAAMLLEIMGGSNSTDAFNAAKGLLVWATPDELEELPRFLGHRELTKPTMEILGKFRVTSQAAAVASFLPVHRKEAAESLIAMGPGAEKTVIPYLGNTKDEGLRREICYILQRIGTSASLPALEALTRESRDKGTVQAAQLAGRTILERRAAAPKGKRSTKKPATGKK